MRLLLFGATGAIGSSIAECFASKGWEVTGVSRSSQPSRGMVVWNPLDPNQDLANIFKENETFDAICWAQGANLNDSIFNFDVQKHMALYESNVLFILCSLRQLIINKRLSDKAKLCIISSIWQNLSRQSKLSYGVTKSAIQGLVLSLSNDLANDGYLVNAVLPGALDTPMTRANLTQEQMTKIESATGFGHLPNTLDVANAVYMLCSAENTGITGQFVKVDYGFSDVRII